MKSTFAKEYPCKKGQNLEWEMVKCRSRKNYCTDYGMICSQENISNRIMIETSMIFLFKTSHILPLKDLGSSSHVFHSRI